MATSVLLQLPDELLEAIVAHLPPNATVAFGTTCKQINKITYDPLVWRRHCIESWRCWDPSHDIAQKTEDPPAQHKWRQLFTHRKNVDDSTLRDFNALLETRINRMHAMERIVKHGYDVKDVLLDQKNHTPQDAEDVLARRYYADAILGQIHRAMALDKWLKLSQRQMLRVEESLGAFDVFVLAGERGDFVDLERELDRIAAAVRARDPEFDGLSTRTKAIRVAKYLRAEQLVGNDDELDYHALRNNFLTLALFDEDHRSLPLQSVAIYCAIARRLGVNASPSNYPQHVHAVIKAPQGENLDGKKVTSTLDSEPELMHMDPWRSSDEMSQDALRLRLSQMGALGDTHEFYLGATSTLEITLRASRNIMTSIQEARDRPRTDESSHPDSGAAWYAMLWSMIILGDSKPATALTRRKQCLPYLIEQIKTHFPEDVILMDSILPPMFNSEPEQPIITDIVGLARTADRTRRAPITRDPDADNVAYKIGTSLVHRRYGYQGVIIGWDYHCSAGPSWMRQMRIDDLPRGRNQPFYHVVADDNSTRYVAEENIVESRATPSDAIMHLAGRFFKRWDEEKRMFVSNIKEEYPDG